MTNKLTLANDGFEDSMILVIGDVHGFTTTYQKFLRFLPSELRTMQIGDMGLGFKGVGLPTLSSSHRFFRGNHDDPARCKAHDNYAGDYGYDEKTGIFHLAGAFSIDRSSRIQGVSWWADEELSYDELNKAISLYEQTKPRFVLSHEAPSKAGQTMLYYKLSKLNSFERNNKYEIAYLTAKMDCTHSRTSEALQQMLDIHQPQEWIFGHYHVGLEFYTPGYNTKFNAVGGMMESGDPPKTYVLDTK